MRQIRRTLRCWFALALCTAPCVLPAAQDASFTAQFHLPGSPIITLDYIDQNNFRFSSSAAALETTVVARYIYIVQKAPAPRVLWVGSLIKPAAFQGPKVAALTNSVMPDAARRTWGAIGPISDVTIPRAGPLNIPMRFTVAHSPQLAAAQFIIHTTFRPAMDMSLCGNAVNQLTAWWPPEITAAGFAVIANAAAVRLHGPLQQSFWQASLPQGVKVEDFRTPPNKSTQSARENALPAAFANANQPQLNEIITRSYNEAGYAKTCDM